jgi:hypothetical protein
VRDVSSKFKVLSSKLRVVLGYLASSEDVGVAKLRAGLNFELCTLHFELAPLPHMRSQIRAHAKQIGEDAAGRDRRPRARPLNDQGVEVVASSLKPDHVVREVDVRKGMRPVQFEYTDRRAPSAGIEDADIAEHMTFGVGSGEPGLHRRIELVHAIHELVGAT